MKKFLCFALIVLMLCGMVACTPETEEEVRGSITSDQNAEENFSLGTTENNRYENEFLGLSCTLSSDWVFYTDEEILELNNIVKGAMDEDVAAAIENASLVYDMFASNTVNSSTVNVNLEKHTALQVAAMNLKTVIESQFPALEDTYKNMGCTSVNIQYKKVTVDGKELDGAEIAAEIAGQDFRCILFCFKKGRYLANIAVAGFGADNVQAILNCFTFTK